MLVSQFHKMASTRVPLSGFAQAWESTADHFTECSILLNA